MSNFRILFKNAFLILFQVINIGYYSENIDSLINQLQNNSAGQGEIYLKIGDQYVNVSAFDLAFENYNKALEDFQQEEDVAGVSAALRAMGTLNLVKKEEYTTAIKYFEKSLKYAEQLKDTMKIAKLYNDLGISHARLLEYDQSKVCFDRSYQLKLSIRDTNAAASVVNNLGELLLTQRKYDAVLHYFNLALSFSKKNDWGKAYVYHNIATLYIEKNQLDSALIYLNKSVHISNIHGYGSILKQNYADYIKVYAQQNNVKKIDQYTDLFQATSDSLMNKESLETMAAVQSKFETRLKTEENKRLTVENQLYNEVLAVQDFKISALIIGLILMVLVSLIIVVQNRNQKKTNTILVAKNLEIVQREQLLEAKSELTTKLEGSKGNTESLKNTKRRQSSITDEKKEKVYELILTHIQKDKPYLDQNFSLQDLADQTETNRSYVSLVINEKLDQSFTTFINTYRISEARRMLSDPANHNLTIEAIAHAVGFRSKSAFNSAFKKFLGITPSFYLKSIRS